MRVVAQRVARASVEVDGEVVGEIAQGLLLFVGVGREDVAAASVPPGGAPAESAAAAGPAGNAPAHADETRGAALAAALAGKAATLRIFPDCDGKSNLSLLDIGGAALVISQFTLYADYRRGRRPSFSEAADPGPAEGLVEEFRLALERLGVPTASGRFGAHMTVSLINDGPYTILLDSDVLAAPRRGSAES